VLYSILVEFGIPRKLAGLIKMCLNNTCRQKSDKISVRTDRNKGALYHHCSPTLL
jgi:hypothetical protein